jgi:hypothetical protein
VGVFFGEPEAARGSFLRVELDEDGRLVADDPGVVPGFQHDHLRRDVLELATVAVLALDVAAREETDVCVHAQLRADRGLHVGRPPEARWVYGALDAPVRRADRVHGGASHVAMISSLDGLEQWVHGKRA